MKHQNYEFLIAVANGDDLSEWEYCHCVGDGWHPAKDSAVVAANPKFRFRRKPKTITINGIEVPEPLRVDPGYKEVYWIASVSYNCAQTSVWRSDDVDKKWLASGLIHSTKEAAEQHRRALILASGGDPDYKN